MAAFRRRFTLSFAAVCAIGCLVLIIIDVTNGGGFQVLYLVPLVLVAAASVSLVTALLTTRSH